jgi:MtaA/CmuA family methyltransferase
MFAVMHQRMGFYVAPNGRLLTLGFYGYCETPQHSPNAGNGLGRVVREIRADGSFGPIHFIRYNRHAGFNESNTSYPFYTTSQDAGVLEACNALLADKKRLARLKPPDPHKGRRMRDRVKAVALFKRRVGDAKLIEGWIEGPCAMGADLRGMNTLMYDYFDDPAFVRDLFAFAVEMELAFARAQIEAGADLIGLGDAASSLVGPRIYGEFVWPWQQKLVDGLHALGAPVRLHICGDTRPNLELMGRLRCEIVDLDFMVPLSQARAKMGTRQVLLGNLHPVHAVRDGTPEGIKQALAECHRQAGRRYIVGAGCEIPRGTPAENLLAMRDYAHDAA